MRTALALGFLLLVAACEDEDMSSPAAANGTPDSSVVNAAEIGIVDYFGESEDIIDSPATVTRSQPFVVEVATYAGGCYFADSLIRADSNDGVALTPYDLKVVSAGDGCPDLLKRLEHEIELVFEDAGEKVVTVIGRRVAGNEDVLTTVSFDISVE